MAPSFAQPLARLVMLTVLGMSAGALAIPPLPVPHSNNAVARLELNGGTRFYSFMGLTAGKTHADISKRAFEYDLKDKQWRALPDVPVTAGRLASTAVGLGGQVFLFGGYTVAADGTEVSTSEVFAFDPATNSYQRRAPMPVPVDDSVALPFVGRYIYLVSGWHDKDNVRLVQVYDTLKDRWFRATDWPGLGVFGHAGAIAGNRILVADGVTVIPGVKGWERFKLIGDAWMGTIDAKNPARIGWRRLPPHPGKPLYRMAATGSPSRDLAIFSGGSTIAYNYNGDGYDGTPATPSDRVFAYEFLHNRWMNLGQKSKASMDHRGLLEADGKFYTIGGMGSDREVIGDAIEFQ